MNLRTTRAPALLAVGLVSILASTEALAGPSRQGPQLGNNRYEGALVPVNDVPDVDDFVQDLLAGEQLTVTVSALRADDGSFPLSPLLTLVDPDGVVRSSGITLSADGRTTSVKNFPLDKSGRWAARIAGRDGSQGRYRVQFAVTSRPDLTFKKQRLGNDLPFVRSHYFSAFDGALLDATITYDNRGLPVEFRALEDPSGDDVLVPVEDRVDPVEAITLQRTKRNKVFLQNIPLTNGDGTYEMRVRIPTAEGKYDLRIKVKTAARPTSRKTAVLSDLEPTLAARQFPVGADIGETVQFVGTNFSTDVAPRVLFDKSQATSVQVSEDGTTITVVVPPRSGAAVVPVFIVNPDGQVACQDNYFAYVPAPEITNLVDPVTSLPTRFTTTGGGKVLRLVGKNFLAGQVVRLGNEVATNFTAAADGLTATFATPVIAQGTYPLSVTDQFGRTALADFTVFCKTPPSFAASPYSPAAIKLNTATLLTISGAGFADTDTVYFNNQPIPSTLVDANTRTILLGGLGAGSYPIRIVDSIGTVVDGPNVDVKFPPSITTVGLTGSFIAPTDIPLNGGTTIRVDGANFLSTDTVTIGSTTITSFVTRTATSFSFVAPATTTSGFVTISVTDGAGQIVSRTNAVRYSGLVDQTSVRGVPGSAADDFGASRGVTADLDADGRDDDVVLVSSITEGAPGSELRLTRLLLGNNTSGALESKTSTNLPAIRTDVTGQDRYDATAVAVGDLDRATGNDIVIGGVAGSYYGAYPEVRFLKNNGSGVFSLNQQGAGPSRYEAPYYAYLYGQSYYKYTVYSAVRPAGHPTAIALGDVDKDGDADVIVGFDHYDQKYVGIDPSSVVNSNYYSLPTIYYPFKFISEFRYIPAVRIFRNDIPAAGKNLVDVSKARLPSVGSSSAPTSQNAALHARDIALGDIDRDTDLDMIVAWDNPTTTTPKGLFELSAYGVSYQTPKIATQVLLNNGSGSFLSNATGTWMPSSSGADFWQADRIKLGDLDNDGDLDLVLVTKRGVDAYTGNETHTRSALRVLRNDSTRFSNVTGSAIPAIDSANQDDWRGESLLLRDVNGDGYLDILVGTTERLTAGGNVTRRTRLFTGGASLRFTVNNAFLPDASIDSGEASELLVSPDLGGVAKNILLLLTDPAPSISPGGQRLRAGEWRK